MHSVAASEITIANSVTILKKINFVTTYLATKDIYNLNEYLCQVKIES